MRRQALVGTHSQHSANHTGVRAANSGPAGIDYFSYLGSDGIQEAFGADFDSKGNMYLVGYSSSDILSRVGGPGRPNLTGNQDAFVIGFPAGEVVPNTSASVHSGRGRRFPFS